MEYSQMSPVHRMCEAWERDLVRKYSLGDCVRVPVYTGSQLAGEKGVVLGIETRSYAHVDRRLWDCDKAVGCSTR